ncbi:flagellar basal body P-ring formation chaperone FlgA [Erwinia oleae]|uniref:flagellar basal body P-ring formation chaperone FlgA n=1 Tax=Erwinia oleae TaxID=796334 RepID=UPI00068FFB98|nr:flagellar basal body P-ring formation chaperone FlgA [Erwinia oleae]
MNGRSFLRKYSFPLVTLWCLSFTAHAASDAATARRQIYQLAVDSATADIKRVAQANSWPEPQIKLNVFIPTEVSRFRRCSQPLRVALPAGNRFDLARLRFDIRCEDSSGWEAAVTVKPDIYLPVLTAKAALPRGKVLAASDVEVKKRNVVGLRDGFISNPDDAVGFRLKMRVRDMQPLSLSMLDQPILVERAQRVVMIAGQDGVEAKMIGEAMKKGRKGDVITVKNLSSQRTVSAIVDGAGVVRILSASDTSGGI